MAIGGIMAVVNTVSSILENITKRTDDLSNADNLKDIARQINDVETNGSMLRVLSRYIIEPTVIVSNTLKTEAVTDKVLKLNVDIFSAFYMQVFTILTNLNNMKSSVAIDLLSTRKALPGLEERSRDKTIELIIDDVTPFLPLKAGAANLIAGNEAVARRAGKAGKTPTEDNGKKENNKKANVKLDKKNLAASLGNGEKELGINSIVQRDINLTIYGKTEKGTIPIVIPVLVKANIVYTDFSTIQSMLTIRDGSKRFMERLDEYRSGGITLSELLFASDLIKEYKEKRLKDKTDLLKEMNNKSISSNIKLLEHGKAGYEKYYNIVIVNEQEKLIIENLVRGKMNRRKYKEIALERMLAMMLTVVDRDYEMVSIFTKDISADTEMTFKSISKKSDKDNDLQEIFKAITTNRQLF